MGDITSQQRLMGLAVEIADQMNETDLAGYGDRRESWRDGISAWESMEGVDMDDLMDCLDEVVQLHREALGQEG
jgi:hypothetical protein